MNNVITYAFFIFSGVALLFLFLDYLRQQWKFDIVREQLDGERSFEEHISFFSKFHKEKR